MTALEERCQLSGTVVELPDYGATKQEIHLKPYRKQGPTLRVVCPLISTHVHKHTHPTLIQRW